MRLILISNRLPITVTSNKGKIQINNSPGGLASGLLTYLDSRKENFVVTEHLWIGWPGAILPEENMQAVKHKLALRKLMPVFLSEQQIENFYYGFANDTLWPLFHWFQSYVNYNQQQWNSYREVNELFAEAVLEAYRPGDIIWIHDFHLLLLPKLLRDKLGPEAKIGFFLHIPFPSFEIFRLLPDKWRKSLLQGMLGSDLIGFHTYDYANYFNTSVQRILGLESNMLKIALDNREVKVDTFPMGIDFQKFNEAGFLPAVQKERNLLLQNIKKLKVIMSADRLDYTKGIIKRLLAYELFLENNKHWRAKVVLMLVVVPSRTEVEIYQHMKSQIDELVGKINGKFGRLNWTPIIYQYKSLNFEQMAALYSVSDVALVTPLRDGMNLVAKEYIAARRDLTGVLVLSEMAGSVYELGEAIIINPHHEEAIAEALDKALTLPLFKQKQSNLLMRDRLKRYTVSRWAQNFINSLMELKTPGKETLKDKSLSSLAKAKLVKDFRKRKSRIIFLDYDGTLVPYADYPQLARPSNELMQTLAKLCSIPQTTVVLTSGRDRKSLHGWFKKLPIALMAEHGMWLKEKNKSWQKTKPLDNGWKKIILPLLKRYADRLPGAFVEEKNFSLVWHYRLANPWHAQMQIKELTANLAGITANMNVQVAQGQKFIEVRTAGVDKGSTALKFLEQNNHDFILAAGDDITDEDLFKTMPKNAYTVKIGPEQTTAKFMLESPEDMVLLLAELLKK